ncbi:WD repeat-containing protein on Y chromosome [Frankliniella fusca]|uniref:WD repeat-containing protein on Y chromosome n=1 Tax=Frankliniella fusca TaxID=407009 RepID=A0AAE1I2B2_9NEOP|nr:WD repeat-containing protein on Y chromosome [Frankliniella fusca]
MTGQFATMCQSVCGSCGPRRRGVSAVPRAPPGPARPAQAAGRRHATPRPATPRGSHPAPHSVEAQVCATLGGCRVEPVEPPPLPSPSPNRRDATQGAAAVAPMVTATRHSSVPDSKTGPAPAAARGALEVGGAQERQGLGHGSAAEAAERHHVPGPRPAAPC